MGDAGHRVHQSQIERARLLVLRQRKEIMQLQRAGISTTSAESLLDRMLNKIDDRCAERDRLKKQLKKRLPRRMLGRHW